jgi:hypothetical protein
MCIAWRLQIVVTTIILTILSFSQSAGSCSFWNQDSTKALRPTFSLHPGAIELGLAGSLSVIEGHSRITLATRAGTFKSVSSGLAGFELALAYSHIHSLGQLDIEGLLSWQRTWRKSAVYPFIALGSGLRQEWLGNFRQVRYPLGMNLGARMLISPQAAIRVEYKFRRILHDPVANFSEHNMVVGFSIFFKNS